MSFICKECADRVGWTYRGVVSHGPCELCERPRDCDDIKPRKWAEPEALTKIMNEREERRAKTEK